MVDEAAVLADGAVVGDLDLLAEVEEVWRERRDRRDHQVGSDDCEEKGHRAPTKNATAQAPPLTSRGTVPHLGTSHENHRQKYVLMTWGSKME